MYKNFLITEFKKNPIDLNFDYSSEALLGKLKKLNDSTLYDVDCIGYGDKLIINDTHIGTYLDLPNKILRIMDNSQIGGMDPSTKRKKAAPYSDNTKVVPVAIEPNYDWTPLYPRDFLKKWIIGMLPPWFFKPKKDKKGIELELPLNMCKRIVNELDIFGRDFLEKSKMLNSLLKDEVDIVERIGDNRQKIQKNSKNKKNLEASIQKDSEALIKIAKIKEKFNLDDEEKVVEVKFIDPNIVFKDILSDIEANAAMVQQQRFFALMIDILPNCCNNNCFRYPVSDPTKNEFSFITIRQECSSCKTMRGHIEKEEPFKPPTGYKIFVLNDNGKDKIYFMPAVPEILKARFCQNALPIRQVLFDRLEKLGIERGKPIDLEHTMESLIMKSIKTPTPFPALDGKKQQCPLNLIGPWYEEGTDDDELKINPELLGISKLYTHFLSNCFEQDHISANHTDNTEANLWTLCKICHAQKTKAGGDFGKKGGNINPQSMKYINSVLGTVSGDNNEETFSIEKNLFQNTHFSGSELEKKTLEQIQKNKEENELIDTQNKTMIKHVMDIIKQKQVRTKNKYEYDKHLESQSWLETNFSIKDKGYFGEMKEPDLTIPLNEKLLFEPYELLQQKLLDVDINISRLLKKFNKDKENFWTNDKKKDLKYFRKIALIKQLDDELAKRRSQAEADRLAKQQQEAERQEAEKIAKKQKEKEDRKKAAQKAIEVAQQKQAKSIDYTGDLPPMLAKTELTKALMIDFILNNERKYPDIYNALQPKRGGVFNMKSAMKIFNNDELLQKIKDRFAELTK